VPLTHVKVFGWYDNEMGSYTRRLGELVASLARGMARQTGSTPSETPPIPTSE